MQSYQLEHVLNEMTLLPKKRESFGLENGSKKLKLES